MKLYHTSPTKIEKINKFGLFDDCLFFSSNIYSTGDVNFIYSIEVQESDIVNVSQLYSENIINHIVNNLECSEEEAEKLLIGEIETHDIMDYEEAGESGWFIQAQQGACAKEMGFKACELIDEQGTVYIIPMFSRENELTEERT